MIVTGLSTGDWQGYMVGRNFDQTAFVLIWTCMAAIPVMMYAAGVAASNDKSTRHSFATVAVHAFGAWINQV